MLDVVNTVAVLALLREAVIGVFRARDASQRPSGQAAVPTLLSSAETRLRKAMRILTDAAKDELVGRDKNPS